MRIRQLNLIRFGKFTDRKIEMPAAEQDIHFIVGPNEAGKSTVRSAIGNWLYGIPARTPLAFIHPMPELRLGGVIERKVEGAAQAICLAFERAKANKNTLRTPDDAVLPDTILQSWLNGLDEQAFARMYALDHTTLVEGGSGILSASDDLGRMLFQSAAGIQHLGQVLQELQSEADGLWGPRKAASREYYAALELFDKANDDLKKSTLRTRDWKSQHDTLRETEQALEEARERHIEFRLQLSRLERIRRVQPMLLSLDLTQARLNDLLALGHVPLLAEDAAQVLSQANQDLALAEAEIQRHERDIGQANTALSGIQVDHKLVSLAPDITEINERRLQFRAHRADIIKRIEEVRVEWQRAQELAASLGWGAVDDEGVRQRLPAQAVRTRLRRLLKERGELATQLKSAQDILTARQQDIDKASQTLAGLQDAVIRPALATAVEQAHKLGDHAAVLADLHARREQLSDNLKAALAALGSWRREPAELQVMVVPGVSDMQGLLAEQRADELELKSLQEAQETKASEQRRIELDLDQLVRTFQPVSREQLAEARSLRDADWDAIKISPQDLAARAGQFEGRIRETDVLADTRLDRVQHEADRQAKTQRLEVVGLEVETLQERVEAIEGRMRQRAEQWMAQSAACGLPQLPMDVVPVWIEKRQAALDLFSEIESLDRQSQIRLNSAENVRTALWAQIQNPGSADVPPSLVECLRIAQEQVSKATQTRGQKSTLEKQILDAKGVLATLKSSVQTAQEIWDRWEHSWGDATKNAGYAESVFPDRVEAELDVMDQLDGLLSKIRSTRIERIDTMQADLDSFTAATLSLVALVAPDLGTQIPEDIVLELLKRLSLAKQAEAAFADWQSRLQRSRDGLTDAQQKRSFVTAKLAPLLEVAGVGDAKALAIAIEHSDLRRELERELSRTEVNLNEGADGLSLEQLRAEAKGVDLSTLVVEIERVNQQAVEVVEKISILSTQHGTQKNNFAAFDGSDQAAKAESQRQEAISRMSEAVDRYLKVHTAARVLKWSMEKFRETKQGPMLTKASAIFSTLTQGSFSRLLVDADAQIPRLFGIRPDGAQVDVPGMSEGSRDQLYLALRLAALDMQVDQGRSMPLIADDLFINFDDQRTTAGLKVLGELSRKMQVVFLTHHDHLVPLAREALGPGLNVVEL